MTKIFESLNILKEINKGFDRVNCKALFEEVTWELRAKGRQELQAQRKLKESLQQMQRLRDKSVSRK